ncbi:MAG: PD-(D/E)XK nuclease family protein, partial [Solirubrobacterales bacterium]|nr:PD-(D/E)XK nuclease family protein [Solirubrobacterales bacterium]
RVFERELGDGFDPLLAGREEPPAEDVRVELLVTDREAEWTAEGLAAPWRVAEARALAERIGELVDGGVAASDVIVLTRATTDLRAYERALEEQGIPTYLIGGRGYWSHPQVVDLVSYLRVLANPRDEEALYSVLASPLVEISTDGLVLLAAAARESGRDPWWVLREPEDRLDAVGPKDRQTMLGFADWAAGERIVAARAGVESVLERALEHTGYDLRVLALPGGQRRLANVRKLMRLGRQHLAAHGPDLRSFLDLVALRASAWIADPDASEAPVESDGLDAVRLMTIHRAKGLEFPVVCVADLGRGPRFSAPVLRVGRGQELGIRLARPGTGRREPALAYEELTDEARRQGAAEERRLFYVAMTRARERLIVSGAARLEKWGEGNGVPMAWLGPDLVSDVSAGEGVRDGVRFGVVRPVPDDVAEFVGPIPRNSQPGPVTVPPPPLAAVAPGPPVGAVSYTSLVAYQRCGYRFYVERVLGIPGTEERRPAGPARQAPREAGLDAAERGTLVHALLENLDFRRPVLPGADAIGAAAPRVPSPPEIEDVLGLLEAFAASELRARLGRCTGVRREQRFSFLHDGLLITGMLDVMAGEPGDRTLIVDYKSDRLSGAEPAEVVAREYATQQLIYGLAGLRAGAAEVEVGHVFLERPEEVVTVTFRAEDAPALEARLSELTRGLVAREFRVTAAPERSVCHGCPAEGGLCSWPLELTRRTTADRLF